MVVSIVSKSRQGLITASKDSQYASKCTIVHSVDSYNTTVVTIAMAALTQSFTLFGGGVYVAKSLQLLLLSPH